jgi:hypothetical protein
MRMQILSRTFTGLGAGALLVLMSSGCTQPSIKPDLTLLQAMPKPVLYSDADWSAVLRDYTRDGLIDYQGLSRNREPLERYYVLLSQTGPTATPDQFASKPQAAAYWANAYSALMVRAVFEKYPVATIYDLTLPNVEYEYFFQVDGRLLNLSQVEDEMLRAADGDVRVLLATHRAAMGGPRLPSEPLRASTLERQLADAAAEALDDPNVLRIDHSGQSVFVWQVILRRQADFVNYWRTSRRADTGYLFNALLELASSRQRRALQSAIGYTFRELPFDRNLNSVPEPTTQPES